MTRTRPEFFCLGGGTENQRNLEYLCFIFDLDKLVLLKWPLRNPSDLKTMGECICLSEKDSSFKKKCLTLYHLFILMLFQHILSNVYAVLFHGLAPKIKQKHNIIRMSYMLYNFIYGCLNNNAYMCCEWDLRAMIDEHLYIFVKFLEMFFRWLSNLNFKKLNFFLYIFICHSSQISLGCLYGVFPVIVSVRIFAYLISFVA